MLRTARPMLSRSAVRPRRRSRAAEPHISMVTRSSCTTWRTAWCTWRRSGAFVFVLSQPCSYTLEIFGLRDTRSAEPMNTCETSSYACLSCAEN